MASDFETSTGGDFRPIDRQPIPGAIIPPDRAPPQTTSLDTELFLRLRIGMERAKTTVAKARENGTSPAAELIASGTVSELAHAQALADMLGIPCVRAGGGIEIIEARTEPGEGIREVVCHIDGHVHHVLDAQSGSATALAWYVSRLREQDCQPALAPRALIDSIDERAHAVHRLDEAVHGLQRRNPSGSAGVRWRRLRVGLPILLIALFSTSLFVMPERTMSVAALLMGLPFLSVTVLRLIAFREVLMSRKRRARPHVPVPAHLLPTYCVLVPLFRETEVLPDLLAALSALDYPAAKLDVILLIEATDLAMQSALLVQSLPPHFRVLVVPECQPRTKPKALNYGLQFARGAFVVVFDAEDRPQPQQLKRAVEMFARGPSRLACVQAQLNIYNPRDSWFTRQFSIEYSTLFDAVLPALENLSLPIPLGGTSNHFRRRDLERIGAWDPFNVTEDADLGIRIARSGLLTRVMPSTTWEEAPASFSVWLPQRTRWLKGWMQTWLVHSRQPGALAAELGRIGAIGVHAVMGGLVVSALVQPLFLGLLAYQIASGSLLEPTDSLVETGLQCISLANLGVGTLVSMIIGVLSVAQRGRFWLATAALGMPFYWLLISLAAYRALYQLVRSPFVWEKTPHGAASRRNRRR